jgi:hypothetical protein
MFVGSPIPILAPSDPNPSVPVNDKVLQLVLCHSHTLSVCMPLALTNVVVITVFQTGRLVLTVTGVYFILTM